MPPRELTCAEVDDQDLDTRYLAGWLSADLAEAFEQHYFGCERCWALLQGGLEVRAAAGRPVTHPGERSPRGRPFGTWWPLAAAAGVTALALGIWRLAAPPPLAPPTLRGAAAALVVRPAATRDQLGLDWSPVSGADAYRVRLYDAQGQVLLEREVTDTALRVARTSVQAARDLGQAYWNVVALDPLRNVIARSDAVSADGATGR